MTEDEERRQDVYRREPTTMPLVGKIEFNDLPQTEPEAYDRIRKWAESGAVTCESGGWFQVGDTDAPILDQVAEIVRRAAMDVIGQEQITASVDIERDARAVLVRMRQSLVAFEIPPERTTETKTKIEQTESVPVSWWDHFKLTYWPYLGWCRWVKAPRKRPINTVVRTDINVTKNYTIEGVIVRE